MIETEWSIKIHKYIVQVLFRIKVSTPKQRSAHVMGMINEINKSAFVRIIGQPFSSSSSSSSSLLFQRALCIRVPLDRPFHLSARSLSSRIVEDRSSIGRDRHLVRPVADEGREEGTDERVLNPLG